MIGIRREKGVSERERGEMEEKSKIDGCFARSFCSKSGRPHLLRRYDCDLMPRAMHAEDED